MSYGGREEVGENGVGELGPDQRNIPAPAPWAVWRTRPAQLSAHLISFADLQRVNAMRSLMETGIASYSASCCIGYSGMATEGRYCLVNRAVIDCSPAATARQGRS